MRPIRLDLNGFASFRDPVTVDFTDADYFALVGPTGSGKSTVIDAMTFALYGSAPRWGSSNSIMYALAPTANRCTVRLVFDIGGRRYVVAREVRRSGAQISQKNCSLERYVDPAATGDPELDEPTEILAETPPTAKLQVGELLGLEFDDFCTCVVLPQGDFATFLRASVTERQNILLKLLGAKHYDAIGKLAGRRAVDASTRIDVLAGQLGDLADATEDAEAAARARETELEALQPIVGESVWMISEAITRATHARAQLGVTIDEAALLGSLTRPDGVADLQRNVTAARDAYRVASTAERSAVDLARAAQQAVEAGPQRRPTEDALGWHRERAECRSRLGSVAEAAQASADRLTEAETSARAAEDRLAELRRDAQAADEAVGAARNALAGVERRVADLSAIRPPDGVAELAAATVAARAAQRSAVGELDTSTEELAAARQAVDDLPERSALDELGRTIEAYQTAVATVGTLTAERDRAISQRESAVARLTEAVVRRDEARGRLEALRVESVAADLRPHLTVGESCPVCDQTVATLPPRLDAPRLDEARSALATAEASVTSARRDEQAAGTRVATSEAELAAAVQGRDQLDRALTKPLPENASGTDRDAGVDLSVHVALVAQLTAASERAAAAGVRLTNARQAADDAGAKLRRLDADSSRIRGELHATLGRLAAERPPTVDADDLGGAWAAVSGWAADRAADLRTAELPAARSNLEEATLALTEATAATGHATDADRLAGQELTAAALAAQRAALAHDQLLDRLSELDGLLTDRPEPAELTRLLTECDRLAAADRSARQAAQTATSVRQAAETARDESRIAWEDGRAAFRAARERLVPLGAPALADDDLADSWDTLVAWAAAESAARRDRLDMLTGEVESLETQVAIGSATLADALAVHGLDPETSADQAVATVMVERERARGHTAEVMRRRAQAAGLRIDIDQFTETRQVARELQTLMSSRRFPQWLADAALDTLVADASASLMKLSNDQFDLTHDKGEFFVIDHADADSRRSVRTLSGGETFQASLALALALSEQLSTLAAGGRTRLDSIFLDEGFGTLDPDALETVAGTLENLAQDDRMVGVITHVAALAERVPVRFEIARDSRTSSITRVGP